MWSVLPQMPAPPPRLGYRPILGTVVLLLASAMLGCAPSLAVGTDNAITTPDARAIAFSEIVRTKTVRSPETIAIIDTTQLRTVLHLDSAAIADVSRRLPDLMWVGAARRTGICEPREGQPACMSIFPETLSESRGILTIRVIWSRMGGCYSFEAVYRVRVRGEVAEILEEVDPDLGECFVPPMNRLEFP